MQESFALKGKYFTLTIRRYMNADGRKDGQPLIGLVN